MSSHSRKNASSTQINSASLNQEEEDFGVIPFINGLPTPQMLQPVLSSISAKSGQKGRAEVYLVENINFAAVDSFIFSSIAANHDATKPEYNIFNNSCMTYALNGIAAGGDSTLLDNTYDPRPAGHNPWENWYERAEYDPKQGTQYTSNGAKP